MTSRRSVSKDPLPATAPTNWFAITDPAERRALLWIIAAALIVRIVYLLQLKSSIFWGNYILDSQALDQWGKEIASGKIVGTQPFFRAPLYGYIVGLIYATIGTGPGGIIIFQMLLGLAVICLTFIYARHLFDRRTAIVAAAVVAVWPTLIFYEGELSITTLEVVLGFAATVFIHRAVELRTRSSLLTAGLVLGMAAITRPTFLLLLPLLPLGFWLSGIRADIRKVALASATFVAAMLIPILPVTIHNVVFGDDFVLIASQGGSNFYLGNSKTSDGITAQQIGVAQLDGGAQDNIASVAVAESETGRKMKPSEASTYWLGRALDDMLASPGRAVTLLAKKFYLFWHGQEIFNNKSLYYAAEYSWLMQVLVWKAGLNFPSGLLFPLMLAGIVFAYRDRKSIGLPVGYLTIYAAVISLFFVCARFRQPIVPVAIILAVYAVVAIISRLRAGGHHALAIPGGVFLFSLVGLNLGGNVESRANLSQFDTILGAIYHRQRDLPRAISYYESALELVPNNVRVYTQLGRAYTESGQVDNAVGAFRRGISQAPDYPALRYNMGIALTRFGRLEEAKTCFRETLALSPTAVDARMALAEVFEFQKFTDSALMLYREILTLAPQHPVAAQKIQQLQAASVPGSRPQN